MHGCPVAVTVLFAINGCPVAVAIANVAVVNVTRRGKRSGVAGASPAGPRWVRGDGVRAGGGGGEEGGVEGSQIITAAGKMIEMISLLLP